MSCIKECLGNRKENKMLNEKSITVLLKLASKKDGVIFKKDYDEIVPEEERQEAENFLSEKDIFIFDEEIEELPENVNIDDVVPKKFINTSAYHYLKEISNYKRLSTEEEKKLLNLYKKGLQAKTFLKDAKESELTDEEIKRLNNIVNEGMNARDTIVYSYHTFVLSIVNHYVRKGAKGNIEYEDLIQSGFEGVLEALEKFDFTKEVKWATHARHYIMNAIQSEIGALRNAIAVSKTSQYNRLRVFNIANQLVVTTGKQPSAKEIAEAMGPYNSEKQLAKREKMVMVLTDSSRPTVNLNMKVSNEEGSETLEKYIPSEALSPLEKFVAKANKELLYKCLHETLNDRELYIIFHRHGIQCDRRYTLEEIGVDLGLTRERVRQIETDIYSKLRNGQTAELLREMLPK